VALKVNPQPARGKAGPTNDFANRLEDALHRADRARARQPWVARGRVVLFALILAVPVIFWRLGGATHDGLGAAINALAWIAFLVDAGVHVDTSILSYLGLKALPVVVGIVIFGLVTATLLGGSEEEQ